LLSRLLGEWQGFVKHGSWSDSLELIVAVGEEHAYCRKAMVKLLFVQDSVELKSEVFKVSAVESVSRLERQALH